MGENLDWTFSSLVPGQVYSINVTVIGRESRSSTEEEIATKPAPPELLPPVVDPDGTTNMFIRLPGFGHYFNYEVWDKNGDLYENVSIDFQNDLTLVFGPEYIGFTFKGRTIAKLKGDFEETPIGVGVAGILTMLETSIGELMTLVMIT